MNSKLSLCRIKPSVSPAAPMALLILVAGCSTPPPAEPPPEPEKVEEPVLVEEPILVEEEIVVTNQMVCFEATGVAFMEPPERSIQSEEFIEASGFGLPSPNTSNDAQKHLTAMEAAQYRALANLAEKHFGLDVTREARTVDMAFAGEEVHVRLDGTLSGISEVARSYDTEAEVATVTLRMAIEPEEDPQRTAHEQALSVEHRKARTVTAARIQATALLREKMGQVYVEQDVLVENFITTHQEARVYVQGLLNGILFSEARWLSEVSCEVTAAVEMDIAKLESMAKVVAKEPSEEAEATEVQ